MNKFTRTTRLTLLAAGLLVAAAVWAAPAINEEVNFQQPDGTTVSGRVHGDEYFNYRTTDDGYVIVENEEGYLEYADPASAELKPSGYRVNGGGLRAASNFKSQLTPGLTPAQKVQAENEYNKNRMENETRKQYAQPMATVAETAAGQGGLRAANHSGALKFLVIMVQFTDKTFHYSQSDFYNLLNQSNFNGVGSTADFYKNSSWNQFQPTFDVWGPVTVNMTSKGAKDDTPGMVYQACQIIEGWGCDFTQYDTDNDGIVDNVYCFFAGYDQAQGGDDACIWSHASSIYWKYQYAPDGKWINGYGCSSELKWASGADRVNIGTFTHEFGHVIGLPDMYRTSGDTGHTPGSWDTMAGGCYLNDSQSPPLFSAYEREMLGWCTIPELNSSVTTLPNMQDSKDVAGYKISNGQNSGECFVMEYRVRTNTQNYGLPTNGTLIWHIDKSSAYSSYWSNNGPNNVGGHPCYDVYEAFGSSTAAGDAVFNSSVMWPFGGNTTFNAESWSNGTLATVTNITDHSTYATFGNNSSGTTCNTAANPVAWFYEDSNYGGDVIGLEEGAYTTESLSSYCLPEDWISSIKVLPGYKVIVYTDNYSGGSTTTWTSDVSYVGSDWNDKISSLVVTTNGTSGLAGLWKIKNKNSGLYWDCDGNSTADNAKVVQWTDEGEEEYQQWELEEISTGVYRIRPASNLNTKCEVYYGKADNNTGLIMYPQTEEYKNAEFILYKNGDYYQIIARHCGKPLELTGASTTAGTQITIYDNNGSDCQHWSLERNQPSGCGHATFYADCNYQGTAITLSEGYYDAWKLRLYGIGDNKLSSIKVLPGYKVTVWDGEGTGTSKTYTSDISCLVNDGLNDNVSSISIDPVGASGLAGTYRMQGYNSGLYWGIKDASTGNSVDLQQQAENATASQTFTLSEYGTTGVYCITNVNSGKVLDVNGAACTSSSDNRASVSQYTYTENAKHQQFIAVKQSDGVYQFVDRNSGMVIEVPDNKSEACDLKMWKNNTQKCSFWRLAEPSYDKWVLSADNPEGAFKDVRWNDIYTWSGVEGATTTGAKEGDGAIAFTINPTDGWWGWGIHNTHYTLDFSEVSGWYIVFSIKTDCTDELAVKITGASGEYSVPLTGEYQISTSGWWYTLSIPFSAFTSQGMTLGSETNNVMFSIVCEHPTDAGSKGKRLEIDNVYYSSSKVDATGVAEAGQAESGVRMYPNPATDLVTVSGVAAGTEIAVYDLLGRPVLRATAADGATSLPVAGLAKGNYLVRAGGATLRLVK